MDIESISGAAAVAMAASLVFLLAARFWHVLARLYGLQTRFSAQIMQEPAERLRAEFERHRARLSRYLGSALVFGIIFVAAFALQLNRLFPDYPRWQLGLLLTIVSIAALMALYRVIGSLITARRIRFERDANIAIGHQLQSIVGDNGRVYHDIETSLGPVDHVLVGHKGLYAIHVVAKRPIRKGDARIDKNLLHLTKRVAGIPLVKLNASTNKLEQEYRALLGHDVRLRHVIAVPGFGIASQYSERHLLVNERNIAMLSGWKDSRDFLMHDDVDKLHAHMAERCRRRR